MFIKRDKKDDCIIAGYVVGDQRVKEYNGKAFVEFGVGMGIDDNGEHLPIVNVTVWNRTIPSIYKGDRVLAAGKLKVNQSGDKVYYSLVADFCIKEIQAEEYTSMSKDTLANIIPIDDADIPF